MADQIPISQLPPVITPALTDVFPVVQGGVTKQESVTQLATLFPSQLTGLFVPTLSFGGAAVGMTGTFVGFFVKTGVQVDIIVTITLTNKGSSVGNAVIGNFPYIGNSTAGAQKWIPMYTQNCTATGSTYTSFAAQAASGDTSAALFNFPQSSAIAVQLANTNFSNTSVIILSGTYWTN